MDQYKLDYVLASHQYWLQDNRFGARADFTGIRLQNLNVSNRDLTGAIFPDRAIFSCDFSNTNLTNIVANNTLFDSVDFTNAVLKNAHLSKVMFTNTTFSNTDLWGVAGDGVYIISLQLGGYNVCYTSEILQINCLQLDLKKVWWMTDEDVLHVVRGYSDEQKDEIMIWWSKWKYQIYQITGSNPAKSVNL